MSEEGNEIPLGWVEVDFEQCIDIPKGPFVKIPQKEYLPQGKYPIIDQGLEFIAGYTNNKNDLFNGDLPVIIFGDHTRIFKFIDFAFAIGADGTKTLKVKNGINSKYIFYYLKSLELPSRGYSRHYRYLRENKILLAPKNEQERVVIKIENIIDRLTKIKQELAQIPPILKKFRQSILVKAFCGELTKQWREKQKDLEPASKLLERIRGEQKKLLGKKCKEPEPIDSSDLPELPEGWEYTRIKDIGEVVTGSTPKTQVSEYWNGNIIWLTPKDLGKNNSKYISDSQRKITKTGYESCSTKFVPKDSIVISTRAPIGHIAIVKVDFCTNQGCKSILPNKGVFSDYLYYFLLHNKNILQGLGSGTTFSELSKDKLEDFIIPLSSSVEQKYIVKTIEHFFAQASTIEKSVKITQAHCEKLTQSILAKAFRGKLVEQDPNDKPAEELLKKLRSFNNKPKIGHMAIK